ncbi:hypothetical protein CL621_00510 [archaeon]|nr:hypothetical protein [archaeon]|tara:strand:+ start:2890 stop:3402 length:513 start_codon:yes stop_codon:yes gene_type:complete
MYKKRGISPLITAILLLGLVISLVTVVIVWSQRNIKSTMGKAEESQVKLSCVTDVGFDIIDACYTSIANDEVIQIKIKNNKDKPLNSGFMLMFRDGINKNIMKASYPFTKEVKAYETTTFFTSLPNIDLLPKDEIKEITVIPKIKSEELTPEICLHQEVDLKVGVIAATC